jgi:hypothetical protein
LNNEWEVPVQRNLFVLTLFLALVTVCGIAAPRPQAAQQPANQPAPLFFREDWTQATKFPYQEPVSQQNVKNPNLELKLYGGARLGAGKDEGLLATQHDAQEVPHIWSGTCAQPCALALRDKNNFVDLTNGRIKWSTRVAGFNLMRLIVKLADGTWLVGDHAEGYSPDYHDTEFWISTVRWRKLEVAPKVVLARDGLWVEKPDLSKVDEVGFTDLMPGAGHGQGGYVSIARFEAYGKPVKRFGSTN